MSAGDPLGLIHPERRRLEPPRIGLGWTTGCGPRVDAASTSSCSLVVVEMSPTLTVNDLLDGHVTLVQ
jgi:hypothetical protein